MPSTITLAVTVRCPVCGTVPYATVEEADKRAGQHTATTRHVTVLEAVRTP